MAAIKAVVFDLDGTLLNTLDDLADGVNYALGQFGYAQRTTDEVRRFVGNGVHKLIERALPETVDERTTEDVFECFKHYYVRHCRVKTGLYDGIEELLNALKAKGYLLAIVSNKLQSGVDELHRLYFSDTVQIAIGERPELRRKPAPDMVHLALEALGVTKDEALYVGDSEVDVATAHAVGMTCVSVLWGFRDKTTLEQQGARLFINEPLELLSLLDAPSQLNVI